MITIVPDGGLCNRMRSLAAAQLLSRRAEQPLRVLWYRTPELNARFDAIFQTAHLPFEVRERWAMVGSARSIMRGYEQCMRWMGKVVLNGKQASPKTFDADFIIDAARSRPVYIRSFAKFLAEPGMFRLFEPVEAIAQQVKQLPDLPTAIGVHIRRTDNVRAIEMSPLEAFVRLMQQEIQQDAGARFFIATDSPETYQTLQGHFGDRVFELKKDSLARDDPNAIAAAVADLYALGSCRKIIGSYWSSFTDTAAELNGIERIVAKA